MSELERNSVKKRVLRVNVRKVCEKIVRVSVSSVWKETARVSGVLNIVKNSMKE